MRRILSPLIAFSFVLACSTAAQSGDDDGRALVKKAVQAAGGEAKLAKFKSAVFKEKGVYYGQGKGLDYTSVVWMKYPSSFKMEVVGVFTMCLDGDKGWMKSEKGVMDMTKDQLAAEQHNFKAGWIASLIPLKDKAFTIKADGSAKVGDQAASVVTVSRDGYPTVKLFLDQKTNLVIKSEFRAKSSEQKGKEILAEHYYNDFRDVDGCKMAHKMVLKHDGKLYVEAEVTEMKTAKLDAKTFAKPASD